MTMIDIATDRLESFWMTSECASAEKPSDITEIEIGTEIETEIATDDKTGDLAKDPRPERARIFFCKKVLTFLVRYRVVGRCGRLGVPRDIDRAMYEPVSPRTNAKIVIIAHGARKVTQRTPGCRVIT